jgi:hypothetical protein
VSASTNVRPVLFIGSSAEGLTVARAVQSLLDHDADVIVWTDGVFDVGGTTLGSLVAKAAEVDFAVMVVNPDDTANVREKSRNITRDNVIFELGLFSGGIGRERTFMVHDRTKPLDLPTDLLGVTPATYQPHASGNFESALGAACNQIRRAMLRLGPRKARLAERLDEATASVETSSARIDRLVELLARSRAVELDIIATQFGRQIEPAKLADIRRDLLDLVREVEQTSP